MKIIFAFNPATNELQYHGPTRSSSRVVNFYSEGATQSVWFTGAVRFKVRVMVGHQVVVWIHRLVIVVSVPLATGFCWFRNDLFCSDSPACTDVDFSWTSWVHCCCYSIWYHFLP